LIDECGEVEEGIASCEVGQRPDDEPGDAESVTDLGDSAAFHLDRLPAQLVQQPFAGGLAEVLVTG
jgi:hypothetical protein